MAKGKDPGTFFFFFNLASDRIVLAETLEQTRIDFIYVIVNCSGLFSFVYVTWGFFKNEKIINLIF